MKNFVQDGKAIEVTAPSATTAGDVVAIGSLVGVAMDDAANGAPVVIMTEGVFSLPADAGVAAGAPVEWTAGEVADVDAGLQVGVAVTAAVGGMADVKIG